MTVSQNLYSNGIVIIVLKTMSSKIREINKYMYVYKEFLFSHEPCVHWQIFMPRTNNTSINTAHFNLMFGTDE